MNETPLNSNYSATNRVFSLLFHEKALFLYVVMAIFLKLVFVYFEVYFPQSKLFATIEKPDIITLVNAERQKNGLAPLSANAKLDQTAQMKAQDMTLNNYFAHTSPTGISPWFWFQKGGYDYQFAGENLAVDFNDASAVVKAWMDSPSHRANMLNPNFSEVGVAVESGRLDNRETVFCVLSLGAETKVAVTPKQAAPAPTGVVKENQKLQPKQTSNVPAQNSEKNQPEQPARQENLKIVEKLKQNEEIQKLVLTLVDKTKKIQVAENLKERLGNQPTPEIKIFPRPRVLGAFTSKIDEIIKYLYIYFSTFLLMALALNALIRFNAQHLPTFILAGLLIILNIGMIYV